ncbi:Metal transporter CNNM2 [Gryllus bimaculatus]|nr:Metal transporter CNNM2 [Gryllus bimaculatus]
MNVTDGVNEDVCMALALKKFHTLDVKNKVTNEYNDLEKDEVNIIAGALEFRKKVVSDVMTKLEDVFMLSNDAILDFETVSEIMKQGPSRGAFSLPLESSGEKVKVMLREKTANFRHKNSYYRAPVTKNEINTVGIKGHMAIVQRVNSEGEGDPFYETVGIVTLEDVIEELIQSEIVDETDVWTDNRSKRRRNEKTNRQDFTVFAERRENQRIHISPQLTLATFQYLSTAVNAFKPDNISETILRRLLKQDVIYHIKVKNKEKARNDPQCIIYSQGKAVDYFVLILEGRVEVTVGRENMMFESGPFTYFGSQALTQNIGVADSPTSPAPQNLGSLQSVNLDSILRYTFVPDYSVRAITEVFYIKIKRSLYLAAKRATLMEMAKKDTQTDFDDEVEKLLHSLDEDDRSQGPMDSPPSHHIQMDKDFLQHQVAACAERSASLVGNDITMLSGSKSSGLSPPPPAHSAGSPGGASIGGLIGRELNGSRKLSAHLSPTKVIGEGTNLLMDGKDGDKMSEKYKSTSPKQSIDDSEERTILLPKPASNTKC